MALESKFNSVRDVKLLISGGIDAKLFLEKSNLTSFVSLDEHICGGIAEKELLSSLMDFKDDGNVLGSDSIVLRCSSTTKTKGLPS